MRNKIISVVLCLGVILALALVPGTPPKVVSANGAQDWGFEIQPNVTRVGFGEAFTVNAVVTHYAGNSTAWAMYLLFDSTLLEVTGIDTPSTLPNGETPDPAPGMPTWNNATGFAQHGYGLPFTATTDINETFVYCTIHFRSKSATGASYLNFASTDPAHATQVLDGLGVDHLNWTRVVNGTVMVGTPQLTVNVTPAGKGDVTVDGVTPSSYPYNTTWSWGDVVSLTAVNSTPGWGFNHWSGDLGGSTNPTNITMDDFTKNVTANFAEQAPAILALPSSLNFSANVGENPPNQTLQICNGGGYILNWSANITDGNVTWLSMSPTMGINLSAADCDSTQVAVNVTGLTAGTYHANITISVPPPPSAPSPQGSLEGAESAAINGVAPVVVPVTLNLGVPEISASPTPLTFTTSEGEDPPDQTLEICNTGTGTLNWNITDGAGWLSENPTSGSLGAGECEDVTVSVDTTGMAAGDYTATITVTGSPTVSVPVNLYIVSGMPEIPGEPASVSASGLDISPQQVKPDQAVTISISVANTGGETGSYNAVLYINGAVEDSQSVSVAGGTSKNVIFTVTKSKAGVYDVSLAGQTGQFQVVGGGWFGGGLGLGTGGIIAIVVIVIALIVAVIFIIRGTAGPG